MPVPPEALAIDIGNSLLKGTVVEQATSSQLGPIHALAWHRPLDGQQATVKKGPGFVQESCSIEDVAAVERWISKLRRSRSAELSSMQWWISSVQPTGLKTLLQAIASQFPQDSTRLITHHDLPMVINVEQPERVGIDRLLAAWAAREEHQGRGPLIVIQAGTAITCDWIDDDGVFQGGAIMPGISMTLRYLAAGTAYLPWLEAPENPTQWVVPGKSTEQAILAGVSACFIGGLNVLIDQYRRQYAGDSNRIRVVLSGGDGAALSERLSLAVEGRDHLVLRGIALLSRHV